MGALSERRRWLRRHTLPAGGSDNAILEETRARSPHLFLFLCHRGPQGLAEFTSDWKRPNPYAVFSQHRVCSVFALVCHDGTRPATSSLSGAFPPKSTDELCT